MHSPRSSAMRPSSPLSPRYEPSRFESLLQAPSTRGMQTRAPATGRHASKSLRLPALPRFHPANYPSAHSSISNTPDGNDAAVRPLSPRTHQRLYSESQNQLFLYHSSRGSSPLTDKPTSPRLVPLGSPGPVTPFELEAENYLSVGASRAASAGHAGGVSHQAVVDRLKDIPVRRHGSGANSSTSISDSASRR